MEKAYANYVKLYEAKEASLRKRGFEMAAPKLSQGAYRMVRRATVAEGVTTNINKTIVSEQAFEYTQKTARQMKAKAKEWDLSWKDLSVAQIRSADKEVENLIAESLKELNDDLKNQFPEWTGKQRGQYISYEVFGSE